MKTFHIYQAISFEYFVEAETEADAIGKIDKGYVQPEDKTELSLTVVDMHNGQQWESEIGVTNNG
jgi:hypothetical protein